MWTLAAALSASETLQHHPALMSTDCHFPQPWLVRSKDLLCFLLSFVFSFTIFLHYNLIFLFLIVPSSSFSMSSAISFLLHLIFQWTLDILVGILTRMWAVSLTKCGLTSGTGKTFTKFSKLSDLLCFPLRLLFVGQQRIFSPDTAVVARNWKICLLLSK